MIKKIKPFLVGIDVTRYPISNQSKQRKENNLMIKQSDTDKAKCLTTLVYEIFSKSPTE